MNTIWTATFANAPFTFEMTGGEAAVECIDDFIDVRGLGGGSERREWAVIQGK